MAHAVDTARGANQESIGANAVIQTLREPEVGLEVEVVSSIRSVSKQRWNALVDRADRGNIYHRHEWLTALEVGLNRTPRHVVVWKDGNLVGCCPNFLLDIEGTPLRRLRSMSPGWAGPLLTTDVADSLSLMTEALADVCGGRTTVHEIRAVDPEYVQYDDFLKSRGYELTRSGCRFLIDLDRSYDAIRSEMSRSRARCIEQGRDQDFEIVEADPAMESLERFYGAYAQVMDRVGSDPFPLSFFEALGEMWSRVQLLELYVEGEYAGGLVELLDDEQSTVRGFLAGIPRESFEYHATELLYDHVIRWGCENGYETYDLGTTAANFEGGSFRFKKGFGGQIAPNLFWQRGCSPLWPLLKVGRSLRWRYDI